MIMVVMMVVAVPVLVVVVVVVVMIVVVTGGGELLEQALLHPTKVEAAQVEDLLVVHVSPRGALDLRKLVHRPELRLDPVQLIGIDQVRLVQHDAVRVRDLLHDLVQLLPLGAKRAVVRRRTLFLALAVRVGLQVSHHVLRVDQGDHALQPHPLVDIGVREEGSDNGLGVRQASRLDENVVELPRLVLHQRVEHLHEVLSHGAADAPVVQQHNVLAIQGLLKLNELLVDADLSELVLDNGDAQVVVLRQNAVQKGRLAGAQEAGDDGGRHARVVLLRSPDLARTNSGDGVTTRGVPSGAGPTMLARGRRPP